MKGKLTDTIVAKAICPPDKKMVEYSDGQGLSLRVTSVGSKIWRYRHTKDKQTAIFVLGVYPEISLQQARQLRTEKEIVTVQTDVVGNDKKKPEAVAVIEGTTFQQLIDEYLKTLENKPSHKETKRCLERDVIPVFGTRDVHSITMRECVLLMDTVKERAPVQANRLYAYLKRAFKVGMQRGLIDNNPMEYVVKPEPDADIRDNQFKVLSRRELQHILQYNEGKDEYRYHDVLLMILWTGARPKEVLNMKWRQIERARWTLGPKEHKNGFRRPLSVVRPLCSPAQEILVKYQGNGCEYVFAGLEGKPGSVSALGKFVTRYRNRYGIDGFSPNHLRHTMSTRMREIGVRPDIVERLIGHNVDTGIISVYSSYSWLPEMREALEKWQNYLRLI